VSLAKLAVLTAVAASPLGAVRDVAASYAAANQGVSSCRLTTHMVITAPLYKKTYDLVATEVHQGDRPVRTVFTRMRIDGREATQAEREAEEAKNNQRFASRENEFYAPYHPEHLDEYTFKAGEAGAIAFTTRTKDAHHGDGRMQLDAAGALTDVVYAPTGSTGGVKGDVTLRFGRSGGMGPVIVGVEMAFRGAVGPLSGSFNLIQTRDRYARHATVDAAIAEARRGR
jgi:hypothetical protein